MVVLQFECALHEGQKRKKRRDHLLIVAFYWHTVATAVPIQYNEHWAYSTFIALHRFTITINKCPYDTLPFKGIEMTFLWRYKHTRKKSTAQWNFSYIFFKISSTLILLTKRETNMWFHTFKTFTNRLILSLTC